MYDTGVIAVIFKGANLIGIDCITTWLLLFTRFTFDFK